VIAGSTEGEDMCKKALAVIIAALTLNLVCASSALAQKRGLSADEAKAEIAKLGTGPKAVVRVTLKDEKKVQGWLSFAGEDHFTVTGEKSGALTEVRYSEVARVKSLRPPKGAVVAAVVVGLALSVVIFLFAGAKH
jgi:hypothetical protein